MKNNLKKHVSFYDLKHSRGVYQESLKRMFDCHVETIREITNVAKENSAALALNTLRSQMARVTLAFALGCALLPALGYGQPYSVDRSVISGGGGTSSDHRYSISGTIGQYDAAPSVLVGGTNSEISGYWNSDSFAAGPIIVPIANQTIRPRDRLAFKVKASDPNADQLEFSLDPGAPAGAHINATNGSFFWVPSFAQASSSNSITVRVTEDSFRFLSSAATFVVYVEDYLELTVGSTNVLGGQTVSVPFTLSSSDGVTNVVFTIQVSDTIFTNALIAAMSPEVGSASVTDQGASLLVAIQASPGQVLHGTEQLAQLSFLAISNPPSAFVPLLVGSVSAAKPGGSAYVNYITHPGWVAMVQDTPLLTAAVESGMQRSLTLYGLVGVNYQLQYTTNLTVAWAPLLNYIQTNEVITINVAATNEVVFYRLMGP